MTKPAKGKGGELWIKWPIFNCAAKDKFVELKQFEPDVTNIFLAKYYDISDAERVILIKNTSYRERGCNSYKHVCVWNNSQMKK